MKIQKYDQSGFDARLLIYQAYAQMHSNKRYNVLIEEIQPSLNFGDFGPMTEQEEKEYPVNWSEADEERADVIATNGNDGLHYDDPSFKAAMETLKPFAEAGRAEMKLRETRSHDWMDGCDGWIKWNGGEPPGSAFQNVVVRHRRNPKFDLHGCVSSFDWQHLNGDDDIIAYKFSIADSKDSEVVGT